MQVLERKLPTSNADRMTNIFMWRESLWISFDAIVGQFSFLTLWYWCKWCKYLRQTQRTSARMEALSKNEGTTLCLEDSLHWNELLRAQQQSENISFYYCWKEKIFEPPNSKYLFSSTDKLCMWEIIMQGLCLYTEYRMHSTNDRGWWRVWLHAPMI